MITNTKRYTGFDMGEILDRIRVELGRDAIIFKSSTRKTGFNGRIKFEVVAGNDTSSSWKNYQPKKVQMPSWIKDVAMQTRSKSSVLNKKLSYKKEKKISQNPDNSLIVDEIKELKSILKTINTSERRIINPELLKVKSHLLNNGVELYFADEFVFMLEKTLGAKVEKLNFLQIIHVARKILEKKIHLNQKKANNKARIKILVGPTGAGKTTTLAKLAAIESLKDKKNIILISLDSYRLGAHAQLKSYADILSVPFYSASSNKDLLRVIKVVPSDTRLFIDTSGISPMNVLGIRKLSDSIKGVNSCDTSLVISATSGVRAMNEIYKKFSITGFKNVILTKVDEISSFGHLHYGFFFIFYGRKYFTGWLLNGSGR